MPEARKKTKRADWPEKAWKYLTRMVAEFQRECYHNSTVPVKEYLEVIGGAGLRDGGVEK